MIGHIQTLSLLKAKKSLKTVFIIVGTKPKWFDGEHQGDSPVIYTERTRPKHNEFEYLRGQFVQLLHGEDASDELFAKWFTVVMNAKPKKLFAIDSEKEIFVC